MKTPIHEVATMTSIMKRTTTELCIINDQQKGRFSKRPFGSLLIIQSSVVVRFLMLTIVAASWMSVFIDVFELCCRKMCVNLGC